MHELGDESLVRQPKLMSVSLRTTKRNGASELFLVEKENQGGKM